MDTTPRKCSKISINIIRAFFYDREWPVGLAIDHSIVKWCREIGSITPQKDRHCGWKSKTAVDVAWELVATSGMNIHATTVCRRLLQAVQKTRKHIKKQLLTPVMCKKKHNVGNITSAVLDSDSLEKCTLFLHGSIWGSTLSGFLWSIKLTSAHLQQAPKIRSAFEFNLPTVLHETALWI